jgi:hypothetical protein
MRDTIATAPTRPIGRDAGLSQSDRQQSCAADEQGPRNAGGAVGRDQPDSKGQGKRGGGERPAPPSSHPVSLLHVTIE